MYTVYFIFFQVASATATRFGLSRGLLGLQYDQINESESESESLIITLYLAELLSLFDQQADLLLPITLFNSTFSKGEVNIQHK